MSAITENKYKKNLRKKRLKERDQKQNERDNKTKEKKKGAPFSPNTGNLRFNLSPASFTHLLSILEYVHSAFGWMSQQLIKSYGNPWVD